MTNIIFISFEFPPLSIGGVFRPMEFARHLPAEGIKPHVYTLSPDNYDHVYRDFKRDERLLSNLNSSDIEIHKVPIDPIWPLYKSRLSKFWNIYFNLYRGDEYKKWEKYLIKQVLADAKSIDFKAVLVTAPPFGMLKLAMKVAKQLNLPLISDMRDAWAYWNMNGYGTYLHYLKTLRKEKTYFNASTRIISTSEQTNRDWHLLHPEIEQSKLVCIHNGYSSERSVVIKDRITTQPLKAEDTFTIAYVGSFYYSPTARKNMLQTSWKRKGIRKLQYFPRKQDWLYRSPYFFLKTIARLLDQYPEFKNRIKIKFAGLKTGWLQEMIDSLNLGDQTDHVGFLNHNDALQLQADADALLITSAKVYGGKDCFIAGKTFEYITMNKPVFAFVSEGAQKELLDDTGLSVNSNPDDIESSVNRMKEIFQKGLTLIPNRDFILSFDRRTLTGNLASTIFDAIERFRK